MLFDDKVVEFVTKHFVCVIADAPWSNVGKRNPSMWKASESWKSAPRNSELVWIVTADKRDRRGLVYHQYKDDPDKLLAKLEVFAREDGRIDKELDAAKRARLAVVNRHRARDVPFLRQVTRSHEVDGMIDGAKRTKLVAKQNTVRTFLATVTDKELCDGDAKSLDAALRRNDPKLRAQFAARVDEMLERAEKLGRGDDEVIRLVREARKSEHGDFTDATGLRYLSFVLHERLAKDNAGTKAEAAAKRETKKD